jgi:methyl-accepting chemotaxis protein
MLSRFKLGAKFTLALFTVFLIGICISGMVLSNVLQQQAQTQIVSRGTSLMQTINSVREYTNLQVRPLIEAGLAPDEFSPETVPSYAANKVFEILKKNPEFADLDYRDAVPNPTNLADKPDAFETTIVDRFLKESNTQELSGYRQVPGQGLMFYSAKPLRLKKSSCLRCHSTPAAAPKAMLATYGDKNGFNWKLNSIIGAQVVYVSAENVFQRAHRSLITILSIFSGIFAISIFLLNLLLKPTVISPIRQLAKISQRLSAGSTYSEDSTDLEPQKLAKVARRKDELGQLAQLFQTMVREVIMREQRLKQQIKTLRIEIDENRKAREVAEIADSDYFQELQEKAKDFRSSDPQS